MRAAAVGRAMGFVAAFAALPLIAVVIARAVAIPDWDEWEWADLVYAMHTHTLTFAQLWAPHSEHRMLVPNVLMLGLDAFGGWVTVREQLVSVALLAVTQLVLWKLVRGTVAPDRRGPAFAVTTVLLFGLVQQENFRWGFQTAWFICNLGAATAVWALARSDGRARSVALAVVAATVASVSSSQGLMVWVAGALAVAARDRARVKTLLWWSACAAIVIAIVRSGNPGGSLPGHAGLDDIGLIMRYVLVYLGAPLAASAGVPIARATGGALVLAFGALAVFAWRSPDRRAAVVPWCAIGAYALACALLTAAGRAASGEAQALSSRYASISTFAWIAVVNVTIALIPSASALLRPAWAACAVVVGASLLQSVAGNAEWRTYAGRMRAARDALARGDYAALKQVYPNPARTVLLMQNLDRVRDGPFSSP